AARGGKHLLLAAGKLRSMITASLLQARKHYIGFVECILWPVLEADEEIFFDGESWKDIAGLRHVAETGNRPSSRWKRGDILAVQQNFTAITAGLTCDGSKEAGLADAIAAQHGKSRSWFRSERYVFDDARWAVTGGEVAHFN